MVALTPAVTGLRAVAATWSPTINIKIKGPMKTTHDAFVMSQFATMYNAVPWNGGYKNWLETLHKTYQKDAYRMAMTLLRSDEYLLVSKQLKYAEGIDSLMKKRALAEDKKFADREINAERLISGKRADEECDKLRRNIQRLNRYSYGHASIVNGWEMLLGAFRNEMDAIDKAYMPQGCRKAAYVGLHSFLEELNLSVERDLARCRAETAIMDMRRDHSRLHRYGASYYTKDCLDTFLDNAERVNRRRD